MDSTPNLEKVRRMLGVLTPDELRLLHDDISSLLTIETEGAGSGHIELKMINGYGPYKYLRRMEGGRLRSIYLGRASAAEVKRYAPKRRRKKK